MNREMQIKEMEDTLNKETERAQDLKVGCIIKHLLDFGHNVDLKWSLITALAHDTIVGSALD